MNYRYTTVLFLSSRYTKIVFIMNTSPDGIIHGNRMTHPFAWRGELLLINFAEVKGIEKSRILGFGDTGIRPAAATSTCYPSS